jgi:hypothetical protein
MANATLLLFLNKDNTARLSFDSLQWIVEVKKGKHRPGRDSGFEGEALARRGFTKLSDLDGHRFEDLQRDVFRFWRPCTEAPARTRACFSEQPMRIY